MNPSPRRNRFTESTSHPRPAAEKREPESGVNPPLGFALQNLAPAHPYLAEHRFTPETVAEFGLGFCNKGSMTGRIVIPIHNADGQLVAFAGRWPGTPTGDTSKYRLPPGFKNSGELLNLHRAIKADPGQPLIGQATFPVWAVTQVIPATL